MSTVHGYYGFGVPIAEVILPSSPLFVGLECEIESIRNRASVSSEIMVEADGSLRNNGMEFITKPVTVEAAVNLFKHLHAKLYVHKPDERFSQRTSIHVHVNMSNLDTDRVRDVILMYALFEEFFFMMTTPDRRENIHCVPLTETFLPSYYGSGLVPLVDRWHKYTALNIKPLKTQGTIEFRHMHGHDDVALLEDWLGTINNLVTVGKQNTITTESLNKANIDKWFMQIFGHTTLRWHQGHIENVMANSLTDLKVMVL